jgi:hypothetical protein
MMVKSGNAIGIIGLCNLDEGNRNRHRIWGTGVLWKCFLGMLKELNIRIGKIKAKLSLCLTIIL